jgi:transposase
MDSTYTVRDLVERYGVGDHTVLGWIRRGELKAIDVSRSRSGRPTWRITPEAITEFEAARTASPPKPRTRCRKKAIEVTPYY